MQGYVFCEFKEFTQKRYDFDIADRLFQSKGSYTLFNTYPFEEFDSLVTALSSLVHVPYQEILHQFGQFCAPKLWRICQRMIPTSWSFVEMLENLPNLSDALMANAITGTKAMETFSCQKKGADTVAILYKSPRKLCSFGKGVINTLADHYHSKVIVEEPRCMLHGDESCEIICKVVR